MKLNLKIIGFLLISLLFIHGNLIADADTLELHSINAATSDTNCMFNEAWTGESGCPDGCGVAYDDTIGCDWSSMQTSYQGFDRDQIWQCPMWAILYDALEAEITQSHKIDSLGFYFIIRKLVIDCVESVDTTYCNANYPQWDSAKDYNTFYAIPPIKISEEYFTFGEGDEASVCPDTGDATYRFRRWPDHAWLLSDIGYGDSCATRILIDSAGIDRSAFSIGSVTFSRDDFPNTTPWGIDYGDTAGVILRGDIATDAIRNSYDLAFYQHKDSIGPANCAHYNVEVNSRSPAYTYKEPYIIIWHSAENDSIPPDTVSGCFASEKTDSSITVVWNEISDAAAYVIRYTNAPDSLGPFVFWAGIYADSITDTTYTLEGLSKNGFYTVSVFAVDAAGNYSVRGSEGYYYGEAVDSGGTGGTDIPHPIFAAKPGYNTATYMIYDGCGSNCGGSEYYTRYDFIVHSDIVNDGEVRDSIWEIDTTLIVAHYLSPTDVFTNDLTDTASGNSFGSRRGAWLYQKATADVGAYIAEQMFCHQTGDTLIYNGDTIWPIETVIDTADSRMPMWASYFSGHGEGRMMPDPSNENFKKWNAEYYKKLCSETENWGANTVAYINGYADNVSPQIGEEGYGPVLYPGRSGLTGTPRVAEFAASCDTVGTAAFAAEFYSRQKQMTRQVADSLITIGGFLVGNSGEQWHDDMANTDSTGILFYLREFMGGTIRNYLSSSPLSWRSISAQCSLSVAASASTGDTVGFMMCARSDTATTNGDGAMASRHQSFYQIVASHVYIPIVQSFLFHRPWSGDYPDGQNRRFVYAPEDHCSTWVNIPTYGGWDYAKSAYDTLGADANSCEWNTGCCSGDSIESAIKALQTELYWIEWAEKYDFGTPTGWYGQYETGTDGKGNTYYIDTLSYTKADTVFLFMIRIAYNRHEDDLDSAAGVWVDLTDIVDTTWHYLSYNDGSAVQADSVNVTSGSGWVCFYAGQEEPPPAIKKKIRKKKNIQEYGYEIMEDYYFACDVLLCCQCIGRANGDRFAW